MVYDLATNFQNGDNPFPFEPRKSDISEQSFDYANPRMKYLRITFQEQSVCMDDNIFASLKFWNESVANKCEDGVDHTILRMSGLKDISEDEIDNRVLMVIQLNLDSNLIKTVVKSYNFLDMMGDLGGIMEVFIITI